MKKFKSTERQGFHMTFENGLTISVQWGFTNYCDNKAYEINQIDEENFNCVKDVSSDTAEISIMIDGEIISPYKILDINDPSDKTYKAPYTLGYLNPEEVLDIMNKVRNYSKEQVDLIKYSNSSLFDTFMDGITKMFK